MPKRPDIRPITEYPDLEEPGKHALLQHLRHIMGTSGDVLYRGTTYVQVGSLDTAGAVVKTLFDANTILKADADDTPEALTVAEQRIVGRITSGEITALTGAETLTVLTGQAGAAFDWNGQDLINLGVITLTEQASAEADVAGRGQLWIKTATPNELYFTDDAGADVQIVSSGALVETTHALLDGTIASDTAASAVTKGDIVIGNATPAWDDLAIGTDNHYLKVATDLPAWEALEIVDDTTPQLGGALDGQGNDLNNLGVVFLTEQAAAESDVAGKGQIWVKTVTPNQLWFTDDAGTDVRLAVTLNGSYSITIEDPTSSEDITIAFTNRAITVTEMRAVLIGTANGQTVTWTIRHHATDRTNAGNEVVTSGTATTSLTSGSDVTAFNDATIPADSFIWLETTAKGGTVTELHITIVYTVD